MRRVDGHPIRVVWRATPYWHGSALLGSAAFVAFPQTIAGTAALDERA